MTTVQVPSRTKAGQFYEVTIALDGTPICSCPASFYPHRLTCWHVKYVQEEMMTNETSRALVPVVIQPPVALLHTQRDLDVIKETAAMVYAGGVSLPKELNSPEKVAAIMLYGLELGLRPMTAIQHLYLVDGKVAASAQVMAGLCMNKEKDIEFHVEQLDESICTIRMIRPSRHVNETRTITWAQIKTAGLARGNNLQYPEDRLTYHTMKRLCRLYAPDLINGLDEGVAVPGVTESQWRVEESDLYNEGDAPAIAQAVQAPPAPSTPAPAPPQPPDELTVAYMDLVAAHGAPAGVAVMDWAIEQWPGITGTKGRVDKTKLDGAQAMALVSEMRRYTRTGVARCAEDQHEGRYNEETTLLSCSVCGLAMEDAPFADPTETPEPVAQTALPV